ncbi:hypothetical protein EHQ53_06520 [Leptospira langatensis]|uniref:Glycosyltransferase RgtA/B/C/D-like domain-containing protein n=1 Tax=Leptospira langatensis TaxID=2484983 RepID=A0ABY2MCL0_9LEPT|nr:glycosyltransferase family 39 protein [Leptospira langatensis]TGL41855.1 hypothetical protein EHQ53_06520 [Leptospira langatensis]
MSQIFFSILSLVFIYFAHLFLLVKGRSRDLENWVLSLSSYLALIGIIALITIVLNIYSLDSLSFGLLAINLVSGYFVFRSKRDRSNNRSSYRISLSYESCLLFLLLGFTAYLYFFFPTEFLLGGRDPGVYAISGVQIAKNGGLHLYDPNLEKLRSILGDSILLGYPGIYSNAELGLSKEIGSLAIQFYHLFPSYLAIGYDLGGLDGLLRVNSLFGILSVCLVYLLARNVLGRMGGIACAAVFALNPAEIWSVRIPLSESVSQFLLLFSFYTIHKTLYQKKDSLLFLPGVLLGLNSFNRVDSLLLIPALAFFSFYTFLFANKHFKKSVFLFFGASFVFCLGIVYGYIFSKPYFLDLWREGSLRTLSVIGAISIGFVFLISILRNISFVAGFSFKVKEFVKERKAFLRVFFFLFFFLLFGYAYFLRPMHFAIFGQGRTSSELALNSLPIFLWYVPISFLIMAAFGYDRLLFSHPRIGHLPWVFSGTLLLLGYLYNPSISPDHLWVSRRWVLFSIPVVLLLGGIGLFSFSLWRGRWRQIGIGVLLLVSLGHSWMRSRIFLFTHMLDGFHTEFQKFSETLPTGNSVFFTTDENLASIFSFVYGRRTYLLSNTQVFLGRAEGLLDAGFQPYLIQSTAYFGQHPNLSFQKITDLKLRGSYPIPTKERYPDALTFISFHQSVFRIQKNTEGKQSFAPTSYEWKMGESGFKTYTGYFGKDLEIYSTRKRSLGIRAVYFLTQRKV